MTKKYFLSIVFFYSLQAYGAATYDHLYEYTDCWERRNGETVQAPWERYIIMLTKGALGDENARHIRVADSFLADFYSVNLSKPEGSKGKWSQSVYSQGSSGLAGTAPREQVLISYEEDPIPKKGSVTQAKSFIDPASPIKSTITILTKKAHTREGFAEFDELKLGSDGTLVKTQFELNEKTGQVRSIVNRACGKGAKELISDKITIGKKADFPFDVEKWPKISGGPVKVQDGKLKLETDNSLSPGGGKP